MSNKNLRKAKKIKNDEFYTFYKDIAKEMKYYKKELEGKVVYLPCDNPKWSNFYKYFKRNYKKLKLKGLIATYYDVTNLITTKTIFKDGVEYEEPLNNNGDFFLNTEILNECDIVITNPPFSLFRDFIKILNDYNKKYIILGNINAITYKIVYELFFYNKLFLGKTKTNRFYTPTKKIKCISCYWYTNIKIKKKMPFLKLTKKYNPEEYPKYDNYDAINVNKVKDIPYDYDSVMGVPINFLEKMNDKQFQLVGFIKGDDGKDVIYRQTDRYNHSPEYSSESCNITIFKNKKDIPKIISSTHIMGVLLSGKETLINNKEIFKRILIQKIPISKK